jgi:hypothetical protein
MRSKGYWVNNKHIVFKDAIKPCKFCGFCPYGQLVEEFPVPSLSREAAIKRNEYMIKSLKEGLFDKMNPDHPDYMTKEDVMTDIKEFDPNDYPEVAVPLDKMRCGVFGHHCPVYYHAELFCEEEQVTQEEIDTFEEEVNEYLKKITESNKRDT